MNVKFEIQFVNYPWGPAGAVSEDGAIKINWYFCRNPLVFASIFLHEAIHWLFDAIAYPSDGRTHFWLDLLYTYIGSYGKKVNRKKMRQMIIQRSTNEN